MKSRAPSCYGGPDGGIRSVRAMNAFFASTSARRWAPRLDRATFKWSGLGSANCFLLKSRRRFAPPLDPVLSTGAPGSLDWRGGRARSHGWSLGARPEVSRILHVPLWRYILWTPPLSLEPHVHMHHAPYMLHGRYNELELFYVWLCITCPRGTMAIYIFVLAKARVYTYACARAHAQFITTFFSYMHVKF